MSETVTPESLRALADKMLAFKPAWYVLAPDSTARMFRAAADEIERLQAVISDAHAELWSNRHSREALMTNPPMNALAYGVAERILKPALKPQGAKP